jgi:AcrR family transcriptional regulator
MAADTRERILQSARDIYSDQGLQEISMRKVAEGAGISTMAAYRHFENKEELVAEVVDEGFRIFEDYFSKALACRSPKARLDKCFELYLEFASENPHYYEVMFVSETKLDQLPLKTSAKKQIKATMQFLVERLQEWSEAENISIQNFDEEAFHLWGHAHGLVSLFISGRFSSGNYKTKKDFKSFYLQSCQRLLKEISS